MDARWQGATQHIELDSELRFDGDGAATEEPRAAMAVLLRGLATSMPYLPAIYKE